MRPLLLLCLAPLLQAAVISDIRMKLSAGDLLSADALASDFCAANGQSSECAAATAWLARGALTLSQPEAAADYLARAKRLTTRLLPAAKLESDPFLLSAIGATIETEARLLARSGKRDQALALLQKELAGWKPFPLQARIQKNINLLSLEGQPAPILDPQYAGKPVLLFLWAHWCGDCKAQAPAIAAVRRKYAGQGLVVLAPTRLYGELPPAQETQEIERIWKESYSDLLDTPHAVDEEAMRKYGVSSTPTLVLIDRGGIVRMFRPYRMSETMLSKQIEAVLARP